MGGLTLFEALTGGAFDRLNCLTKIFQKNEMPRGLPGGGEMGGFGIDRYIIEATVKFPWGGGI